VIFVAKYALAVAGYFLGWIARFAGARRALRA
jgi:hypothetical protein